MLRQMVHAFDARVGSGVSRGRAGSGVSRGRVGGGLSRRRSGPLESSRRVARRSARWVTRARVGAWLALALTALPSLAAAQQGVAQQGASPPARFVVVPVAIAGVSSEPVSAVRDAL